MVCMRRTTSCMAVTFRHSVAQMVWRPQLANVRKLRPHPPYGV